jgi:hypothetical protein
MALNHAPDNSLSDLGKRAPTRSTNKKSNTDANTRAPRSGAEHSSPRAFGAPENPAPEDQGNSECQGTGQERLRVLALWASEHGLAQRPGESNPRFRTRIMFAMAKRTPRSA